MNLTAPPAPLKKTAAIRRAREHVAPPSSSEPPCFVVRVPSDVGRADGDWVDVTASNYLEAQHVRAYAISRIALTLMGLEHVPLAFEEGGTIDQFMDKALDRAMSGWEDTPAVPFWQVRLSVD